MSVTTRTGDGGFSRLLTGERVSKGGLRLEAYGTVDELNSILGVVISLLPQGGTEPVVSGDEPPSRLRKQLFEIQRLLFGVGSDLATPKDSQVNIKRVSSDEVRVIDEWIEELESALPELKRFILPSGSKLGSFLHQARTVCRRAERCTVRLAEEESSCAKASEDRKINEQIQIFLNRLSDYLFLCARRANRAEGLETEI